MSEASSTQQFLEIAGIQDGVVILKNGSYRMIFSVSTVNFSLKSEEEQNSLIFQYQSFLNSLHFPIQIVMRSKRLDLNPYIKKINEVKEKQKSELIKVQTEDYLDFISQLINLANIMKKTFYVVITYDPVSVKSPGIVEKLFKKSEPANLRVSSEEFKRYKEELSERASTTVSGLGGLGLHCVQLTTEEIIELFYKIYNPEIADKERFSNVEELTSAYIADIAEKPASAKDTGNKEIKNEEEERIDNSQVVEEKHKQDAQMKEMGAQKEGEKQIVKNPPAPEKAVETSSATPATPTSASNIQQPVPPNATTVNSDIKPAQAPAAPANPPAPPAPPAEPKDNPTIQQ